MTLPHISYTPDIAILAVLGLITVYGLLLGRNKVKTLALSAYVGLVIGSELGPRLWQYLEHKHFGEGLVNQTTVQLGLFILPLLALELGRREHHGRGEHKGGMLMTLILCLLTAALALSSGLKLWDPHGLQNILDHSTLATLIYGLRLWWIGLVPVAVIGENLIPKKEY